MKSIDKKNPYATISLNKVNAINPKPKNEPKGSKRVSSKDLRGGKN